MASIKLDTIPWNVPNFVRLNNTKSHPAGDTTGLPLKSVPAETLAQMCDEYRAEVFRKAGKKDPGS